ncbi:flavodoxin family protein [Altericroceibacterium xinjiangense]|uniref:flavodoxin family protein n=1 Tax=Altericroceibacterium xinjiangense TaxID=762261 RepID=UPI000F7F6418|nr:NAD(P)H-dependent oxidoreductase [Altericroceibacterium xinjiangense]
MPITAIAINCTLKSSEGPKSSTSRMIRVLADQFDQRGVATAETLRMADYNILPGVTSDEGEGDDWPMLREKLLAHDILIFGGPIWMGQISSVAKRVLERMDAFLSETDQQGRMPSYGKVAVAAIVGNEDGAHYSSAQLYQALNDVGWTIPANAVCYWNGAAMGSTDFKQLDTIPDKVTETAKLVAGNAAHVARVLKEDPYPGS